MTIECQRRDGVARRRLCDISERHRQWPSPDPQIVRDGRLSGGGLAQPARPHHLLRYRHDEFQRRRPVRAQGWHALSQFIAERPPMYPYVALDSPRYRENSHAHQLRSANKRGPAVPPSSRWPDRQPATCRTLCLQAQPTRLPRPLPCQSPPWRTPPRSAIHSDNDGQALCKLSRQRP